MANKMIIDASHPEETRVVVLKGNRVEEFDFEAASKKPLRGNIYLAKVTRVEPSLQAAFVDYGGNRHGFASGGRRRAERRPSFASASPAARARRAAAGGTSARRTGRNGFGKRVSRRRRFLHRRLRARQCRFEPGRRDGGRAPGRRAAARRRRG